MKPHNSYSTPRPNAYDQAWCADITYIPVTNGFFYLVAVMDWASRHVLSWRLSNTMDSVFCIDALEAALHTGTPEIFNTDQGSQFTSKRVHRPDTRGWRTLLHGRPRPLSRQHLHREAVAVAEVRVGVPARTVRWTRCRARDRRLVQLLQQCAPALVARRSNAGRCLSGHPGRCGMSHPGSVCAGNATAVAASSRYAAPPLRSGPSGDTATAVAKWLIMTGRVLPVITDRHLTSAPTEDPTMPLTSSRAVGNVRSSRAKNQSEYTLSLPLTVQRTRTTLEHLQSRNPHRRQRLYGINCG